MDLSFPQYRKGVPKAGLDDITHFILALCLSAIPYFFLSMAFGDSPLATVLSGAGGWATFKFLAVPGVRYIFQQLPPSYIEHTVKTINYRGGLATRPDPDPIPFKVD